METVTVVMAAIAAAQKLIDWVGKIRATAAQDDSWTPEQRAQVDSEWARLKSSAAWATADEETGDVL